MPGLQGEKSKGVWQDDITLLIASTPEERQLTFLFLQCSQTMPCINCNCLLTFHYTLSPGPENYSSDFEPGIVFRSALVEVLRVWLTDL